MVSVSFFSHSAPAEGPAFGPRDLTSKAGYPQRQHASWPHWSWAFPLAGCGQWGGEGSGNVVNEKEVSYDPQVVGLRELVLEEEDGAAADLADDQVEAGMMP